MRVPQPVRAKEAAQARTMEKRIVRYGVRLVDDTDVRVTAGLTAMELPQDVLTVSTYHRW